MTFPLLSRQQQVALPGILGGLGPLAHLHFEQRLIEKSKQRGASCDQDYPVWLLVNGAVIPDRTQSIQGTGPDCTGELMKCAQWLEQSGADFLLVTCNTAHCFYEQVQAQLEIPWIHLMTCTTQYIRAVYPTVQRVGVLATDGTLHCGLYNRSLSQVGLTPISFAVNSPWQNRVMEGIYHPNWGIKATGTHVSAQALDIFEQAAGWLRTQGAEVVIAGCTELSVAFAQIPSLLLPWVDPLEVVADLTLDLAWGHCSLPLWQVA
jgi:aspartate racemase